MNVQGKTLDEKSVEKIKYDNMKLNFEKFL